MSTVALFAFVIACGLIAVRFETRRIARWELDRRVADRGVG